MQSKRTKKRAGWLDVGDRVRVRQTNGKPGPTLWEVVTVCQDSGFCTIREVHPTIKYAPQDFDSSLLLLEPDGKRTARAMNESGAFKPFTVRG